VYFYKVTVLRKLLESHDLKNAKRPQGELPESCSQIQYRLNCEHVFDSILIKRGTCHASLYDSKRAKNAIHHPTRDMATFLSQSCTSFPMLEVR
jgi:hypothetical protein